MGEPIRIAMWSGPRTISTALMRAWENRPDTSVCDEPLYAHYFRSTGIVHPGRDETLAAQDDDWRQVAAMLTGPVPGDKEIFYQKHMAHHLLPQIERDWLRGLRHAFLLRDPREMLLSLHKVTPSPSLADTGLEQQLEIFEALKQESGRTPAVLDGRDVLQDPKGQLSMLCAVLNVEFDASMLSWPAGKRASDGVWAPHWYAAVENSTCFGAWRERSGELGPGLQKVYAECMPYYEELYAHRLRD